jgi:acyl carrier protein
MSEHIQNAVVSAVQDVNAILPVHMQLSSDPDAVIFGKGGRLDSLGLVNLVLAVEEKLEQVGLKISLTDERAMSQNRSPFRSIQSLTTFISELVREQGRA